MRDRPIDNMLDSAVHIVYVQPIAFLHTFQHETRVQESAHVSSRMTACRAWTACRILLMSAACHVQNREVLIALQGSLYTLY